MKYHNIGTWLRYCRKSSNLSVNDVIEKFSKEYNIEYTNKAVYGWETGQNQPPADTFLILCKMYHVTNILESMGYVAAKEQEPLMLSQREEELILKYRANKQLQPAIHKLLDIKDEA